MYLPGVAAVDREEPDNVLGIVTNKLNSPANKATNMQSYCIRCQKPNEQMIMSIHPFHKMNLDETTERIIINMK
jgi:hypothetical protein